jgi:glycosyltransferase involved in cell wall biosynthesis
MLVADDAAGFAGHLVRLIDDAAFRAELAQSAYDYAQRNFTAEVCYGSLLAEIEGSS